MFRSLSIADYAQLIGHATRYHTQKHPDKEMFVRGKRFFRGATRPPSPLDISPAKAGDGFILSFRLLFEQDFSLRHCVDRQRARLAANPISWLQLPQ